VDGIHWKDNVRIRPDGEQPAATTERPVVIWEEHTTERIVATGIAEPVDGAV
jgi:hypothetical protein